MKATGRLVGVLGGVAIWATIAIAIAAPAGSLSTSLPPLASLGCARVPEASGPDHAELQCADDRAYLLCTAMQAQDPRLDCAIDPAASKVDLRVDPAVAVGRPTFATLAETEPCVAWAYPDPGADKQRHGSRCSLDILTRLHCTVTATGVAACPIAVAPACTALHASGYLGACAPARPR